MSQWSKESDGTKPKWLSDDEKARCYCDGRGWVLVHLDGTEEVLISGNSLNTSTDDAATQAAQKAAAVAQKNIQISDDDGDGVREYQDADDTDPNVS